jgi:hypothetical protein
MRGKEGQNSDTGRETCREKDRKKGRKAGKDAKRRQRDRQRDREECRKEIGRKETDSQGDGKKAGRDTRDLKIWDEEQRQGQARGEAQKCRKERQVSGSLSTGTDQSRQATGSSGIKRMLTYYTVCTLQYVRSLLLYMNKLM